MTSHIKVVGFDLDDTLLELDNTFVPEYFKRLDRFLCECLSKPLGELLPALLHASNRSRMATGQDQTLEDVFYQGFFEETGIHREQIRGAMNEFHLREFPKMEDLSRPVPGIHGILAAVASRGMLLALTTIPLFPAVVIQERLRWAGIEDIPFMWRKSVEDAKISKPHRGFFTAAAEDVGISPREWLIVGDDWTHDIMPARQAGMQTFWIAPGHTREGVTGHSLAELPLFL